jgi:hypothetical protein
MTRVLIVQGLWWPKGCEFVSNVRKRANVGDAEKLKGLIINTKSPLSKEQEALIG